MNKSFPVLIGVIIGLVITKLSPTPITWESIGYITVFFIVISHDQLYKVVFFFFGLTYLIDQPITWIYGTMNWYSPLIYLYILTVVLYNFLPKKWDKPLFVDYGDITRFPVEFEKTDEEKRTKEIVNSVFNCLPHKS